jgi:DNA-binding MarR family transcriptional regulator
MKNNIDAEKIWKMLFKTTGSIHDFHNRSMPDKLRHQATLAQLKVMGSVFSSPSGEAKVKDIADELGITPGGVSQAVDKLVKAGMLERHLLESDRRSVSISLSEKGYAIRTQTDVFFTALTTKLLKNVSKENQFIFYEVLKTMVNELENEKKSGMKEK